MNYDYCKLKGRIVEKFGTFSAFAAALGVHKSVISAKLSNERDITKADIYKWSELLEIEKSDIGTYFFTLRVK